MEVIDTIWSWKGNLSRRQKTDYIVLHHAEASKCSAKQIDEWHKANGWIGIGYHYFVKKDGSIYRGRPMWSVGAHVLGRNDCSLGICAEGSYMTETMPDAQKKSIAELLDYLKKHYYPEAKIVGHREIGDSNCPGKNYPLDELKNYKDVLKEEPMTNEEKAKMEAIDKSLSNLYDIVNNQEKRLQKQEYPMVYNYVDNNMPSWAKDAVTAAMNKGVIVGEGDGLGLTYSDLRSIVREYRAGLYN